MEEEIIELNNLFTAYTATENTQEVKRLDTIICTKLNNGNEYQDVITKTIYKKIDFNPRFIISIVDKCFAISQAKSKSSLSLNHIIKAINILTSLKSKKSKGFFKTKKSWC